MYRVSQAQLRFSLSLSLLSWLSCLAFHYLDVIHADDGEHIVPPLDANAPNSRATTVPLDSTFFIRDQEKVQDTLYTRGSVTSGYVGVRPRLRSYLDALNGRLD